MAVNIGINQSPIIRHKESLSFNVIVLKIFCIQYKKLDVIDKDVS
jgi:hypothetical protein